MDPTPIPLPTPFPIPPIPTAAANLADPLWDIPSWEGAVSAFQTIFMLVAEYRMLSIAIICALIYLAVRWGINFVSNRDASI